MKNKEIRVNGKRVDKDVFLQEGDVVSYFLTKKQEEKPAFHVVYEDERVLVVDKESGVNSEAVFSALQRVRPCYFIHRLDRNTKGLLIFSLDERAESSLLSAFKERRVEKKSQHRLNSVRSVDSLKVMNALSTLCLIRTMQTSQKRTSLIRIRMVMRKMQ